MIGLHEYGPIVLMTLILTSLEPFRLIATARMLARRSYRVNRFILPPSAAESRSMRSFVRLPRGLDGNPKPFCSAKPDFRKQRVMICPRHDLRRQLCLFLYHHYVSVSIHSPTARWIQQIAAISRHVTCCGIFVLAKDMCLVDVLDHPKTCGICTNVKTSAPHSSCITPGPSDYLE